MPRLNVVIGGNGAGKSTWCSHHRDSLPEHFYNPDAVAEGIGGWNRRARQREAGELVARRIREHLEKLESFGFESTYSGRTRPRIVERAKALGYEVDAVFIGTRTAEINVERVAARVTSRTGHAVETTEIHRRWRAAQDNLARTAGSFRRIALWDNSGGTTRRVGLIDATDIPVLAKPTPEWARKLATAIEGIEANAAEARSGS